MKTAPILDKIDKKSIIITPNRRISEWLKARYAATQVEQGLSAWITPQIMPLSELLQQLWQSLYINQNSFPTLLNTAQAQFLWKRHLAKAGFTQAQHTLISTIWEAWRLHQLYQIDLAQMPDYLTNHDQLCFKQWAQEITRLYKEKSLMDEYTLPAHLEEYASACAKILKAQTICLYAFLDQPPAVNQLLKSFEQQGVLIEHDQSLSINQHSIAQQYATEEQELNAMLDWCQQQVESQKYAACIVPNLNQIRSTLKRKLSESISSEHFNMSSPLALLHYPLIEESILFLEWQKTKLPLSRIKQLLESTLIQTPTANEIKLPKANSDYFQFYQKQEELVQQQLPKPIWHQAERTLTDWAGMIRNLLINSLWHQIQFSNFEQDLAHKCLELLDVFKNIDLEQHHYLYTDGLEHFKQLLQQTPYEPLVNHQAPIQILGQLEGAGLEFDSIWFYASHNQNWPPAIHPNPFIPTSVQQKKNIPHADPKYALQFYENLMKQIYQSGKNVIYSFAEIAEGLPMQQSAFIQTQFKTITDKTNRPDQTQKLESIIDHYGPAFEGTRLKGGTYALASQAQCPFKYFAAYRLNTAEPEEETDYIDFKLKGQMIHEVMARVWQQLKSHTHLLAYSNLEQLLLENIQQVCHDLSLEQHFSKPLVELEIERIQQLLSSWFELCERPRAPFEVIQIESAQEWSVENITIPFRVDRVDSIPSEDPTMPNSIVIIDYKTGLSSIQDWLSEPLIEPQLPLYLLALNAQGIVFAQVRHKEMALKGVIDEKTQLLKIKSCEFWQEQLNTWQDEIKRVVQEIKTGFAQANPVSISLCEYCDYRPLCRFN